MAAGAASFLLPAALVDQSALGRWAVYALTTAILAHLILLATGHGSATRVRTAVAALISFSLLATASVSWLGAISRTVPEPYLVSTVLDRAKASALMTSFSPGGII